ncbi:MFS transporter [Rhodococcus opacus]|uniref:MFS transporter n=1 Tax=Rhodococcus opacus TaxID=37919 RepID=UPI000263BAE3|nr:MFS transporter [Rhodococcus opacus]
MLFTAQGRRPSTSTAGRSWSLVVWAGIASIMTAPGQTAAISVFTDSLIDSLGIGRTQLSVSYLVGTLAGAAAMPWVGRALDRFGVRVVMAAIAALFGAVLIGISFATDIVGLTAGFVGIRMAGQGALGLAATTLVAKHVTERRGLALGVTAAAGSAGISLAPVLLERLVSAYGIAAVWRLEGLAVWVIVLPVALLALRHLGRPPAHRWAGQERESGGRDQDTAPAGPDPEPAFTARAAVRTAMFWAIASGLAAAGMLTTAVNFHQVSVLGEQGLSATEAAANFIPQTVAGLLSTLAVGALADRIAPKYAVALSMLLLAASLAALPLVRPGWAAIGYGLALGCSAGSIRAVEAAAYAHYFGTGHLGAIRGIATMISVGSTAFGPLALSFGHDLAGNYATVVTVFAALPVAVVVFAALAPDPRRGRSATGAGGAG